LNNKEKAKLKFGEDEVKLSVLAMPEYDVIVCGAGPSGSTAVYPRKNRKCPKRFFREYMPKREDYLTFYAVYN